MSTFTNKVMMFAVMFGAGAGHVFATKGGHFSLADLEKNLGHPVSTAQHVAATVKADAPEMQALATTGITLMQVGAAATGNDKLSHELGTAQILVNGVSATVEANDLHSSLKVGEQTVLTIDPHAAGGIATLNHVVKDGDAVAAIANPLVHIAVANTGATHN